MAKVLIEVEKVTNGVTRVRVTRGDSSLPIIDSVISSFTESYEITVLEEKVRLRCDSLPSFTDVFL